MTKVRIVIAVILMLVSFLSLSQVHATKTQPNCLASPNPSAYGTAYSLSGSGFRANYRYDYAIYAEPSGQFSGDSGALVTDTNGSFSVHGPQDLLPGNYELNVYSIPYKPTLCFFAIS